MAKKKEAPPPEKKTPADLIKVCAAQGVTVFRAAELLTPQQVRRPTGIPNLDVAIAGGFPAGALSNVYGPQSVGKSWLMWKTLALQQQIYGDDFFCVYVSLGVYPDLSFARMHGLKIPYARPEEKDFFRSTYFKIHGALPTEEEVEAAGEKVGELVVLFAHTKLPGKKKDEWVDNDKPMERLLQSTVEISKQHACQMIVVDDIGGMPTQHRMKDLFADKGTKTADYAKLLTEWVQRLTMTLQMTEDGFNYTSVISVSQVRLVISAAMGGYSKVSSQCIDHLVCTGIYLKKASTTTSVKEEAGPRPIEWRIWKGKFGHADGARGKYVFTPTVGIDYSENLLNTANSHGLITKRAGIWTFEDDLTDARISVRGEGSFMDVLDADPVAYKALYDALIRKRCPGIRYRA